MTLQNFQVFEHDLSQEALDAYSAAEAIAIDTETMGLVPQRDRLCLIQLSDPQGHVSAIRVSRGQSEAPNLKRLVETPTIEKIFHYARFDVTALRYHLSIEAHPIFCTKIASKLARTYSPRHGLKELVKELENIELDKSAQSSDWGNADQLSDEQLAYAANDVRYLNSIKNKLTAMLQREGRWAIAQSCFECLPTIVTLDLMHYSNIFEH